MKSLRHMMRERVLNPLGDLLRMGITPHRIALSISTGTIVGIFPLLGTTTALCVLLSLSLRLNIVAMQAFNWLVAGLQLILIIPFIRLGEWFYRAPPLPLTRAEIELLLDDGVWHALQALGFSLLHAVSGWLLVAPFVFALTYFASIPFLKRGRVNRTKHH